MLTETDLKTLLEIVASKLKGETQQDDKTMIMERTIKLVAGLPNHSKTQEILTNSFIDQLWESLDHPALLYMGNDFKWRRPDGSFNVGDISTPKLFITDRIIEHAHPETRSCRYTLFSHSQASNYCSRCSTRP